MKSIKFQLDRIVISFYDGAIHIITRDNPSKGLLELKELDTIFGGRD